MIIQTLSDFNQEYLLKIGHLATQKSDVPVTSLIKGFSGVEVSLAPQENRTDIFTFQLQITACYGNNDTVQLSDPECLNSKLLAELSYKIDFPKVISIQITGLPAAVHTILSTKFYHHSIEYMSKFYSKPQL